MENQHYLHKFPCTPLFPILKIDSRIIEAYATLISEDEALLYIQKANQFRLEADVGDESVTIIQEHSILPIKSTPSLAFWRFVFKEAGLHSPRMLAALLEVLPHDMLPPSIKELQVKLVEEISLHK
jgi:hypothetical protein